MGKQMSKVSNGGGVRGTRRQRSQVISPPTVVSSPEPPRLIPETTDRALLTLKLQRDELTVYKGRVNAVLRNEEETIRRLLKTGQAERAKLLLKKKRFQEHLLQETEKVLNSILSQTGNQDALPIRKEVDDTIARNGEAMKRLHILLSLENAELLLRETYEGSKKQSEVDRVLQLATVGEQELLEKDADVEMKKLEAILGIAGAEGGALPEEDLLKEDGEAIQPDIIEGMNDDVNELEQILDQKLKEKTEEAEASSEVKVEDGEEEGKDSSENAAVKIEEVASTTVVASVSELTTNEGEADDEKSSPSENNSQAELKLSPTEISSLLPDVPTHSIASGVDMNNEESVVKEGAEQLAEVSVVDNPDGV